MDVSRKGFLAGTTAAVAAGSSTSLVSAGAAPSTVTGMTFTTLRDGSVDHLGIRTAHGIIDVDAAPNLRQIPMHALCGGIQAGLVRHHQLENARLLARET